jgi:hypothetical protein
LPTMRIMSVLSEPDYVRAASASPRIEMVSIRRTRRSGGFDCSSGRRPALNRHAYRGQYVLGTEFLRGLFKIGEATCNCSNRQGLRRRITATASSASGGATPGVDLARGVDAGTGCPSATGERRPRRVTVPDAGRSCSSSMYHPSWEHDATTSRGANARGRGGVFQLRMPKQTFVASTNSASNCRR